MRVLYVLLVGYALFSRADRSVVRRGAVHHGVARARDRPDKGFGGISATGSDEIIARANGEPAINREQMKTCCQKIVRDIQRIYYLNCRNGKVKLVVRGIYVRGEELFFSLRLINRSALDYEVDSLRFFVAEKKNGARAPRRTGEVKPVFIYDSVTLVKGRSRVTSVVVIRRLTLARHRRLQIEVLEKNGARQLVVQTANFTLEMAKMIGNGNKLLQI
jgi:hypothetical protein